MTKPMPMQARRRISGKKMSLYGILNELVRNICRPSVNSQRGVRPAARRVLRKVIVTERFRLPFKSTASFGQERKAVREVIESPMSMCRKDLELPVHILAPVPPGEQPKMNKLSLK